MGATAVNYQLSEAATLTFRVQKASQGSPGARALQAADAPQPQPAALHPLGSTARQLQRRRRGRRQRQDPAEAVPPRRLRPGRYRLVITAVDRFGNETQTTKRFRVR